MNSQKDNNLNQKVIAWWEKYPFTYGIAKRLNIGIGQYGDQVGKIDLEKADINYFIKAENKFRRHSGITAQQEGAPILSNFIDYNWLKGKKALDIATGIGWSTVAFAKGGAHVTSIDITNFAVQQTKKNLICNKLHGEVYQMDAQQMKFSDANFDFVNAWGCLMHMPNTQQAINEIYRVLKPEGRLLSYMYNKNSFAWRFNIFFFKGILRGHLIRYKFDLVKLTSRFTDGVTIGGNALTKVYTPREAKQLFQNAGFKNIRVSIFYRPNSSDRWPFKSFPVFKYLPKGMREWMSRKWDFGLIIRAEK